LEEALLVRKNKLVSILAVAGLAVATLGFTASTSHAAVFQVRLYVSGDTNVERMWLTELIPAFEKANPNYNVDVSSFDLHGKNDALTLAKIIAASKLKRDAGFDVIEAGFVQELGLKGYLTIPTSSRMPNINNVPASLLAMSKGGIPYRASTVLLAYNSQVVTTPPKTLDDLIAWIKANPGRFTYNVPSGGGSGYSFAQTVVDKYLTDAEIEKLVTEVNKPLQAKWKQGFDLLKSLNPYTYGKNGTYPSNNAATLSLVSNGSVDMATVWSDQFLSGLKAGTIPSYWKVAQVSDRSLTGGPAILGIPKGTRQGVAAQRFVNWLLSPVAQNIIVGGTLNGYPVVPVSMLSTANQGKFAVGTDVSKLRSSYLSSNNTDFKNQWALEVPGK
jgi:putative spermidine/putrescine transport system substrate-binding protein